MGISFKVGSPGGSRPKLGPTSALAPAFAQAEAESESAGDLSPEEKAQAQRLQEEGNEHAMAGNFDSALRCWEQSLALVQDNALLHEQKAQVLMDRGDTWRAIQSASTATQLESDWPEGWVTLARAQQNYGEPELAIKSYERALQLQPGHSDAAEELVRAQALAAQRRRLGVTGRAQVVEEGDRAAHFEQEVMKLD